MKFLRLSLLAASLCVAPAPAPGRDATAAPSVVAVKRGREVKVKGEDLRITFLAVEEDSRCPAGVQCIQAGNARVRLMARNSKGACAEFVMNTNGPPNEYEFGKYRIVLGGLLPLPSADGDVKARAYEVALTIVKAKK